jgi:hypothetical protein
MTGDVTADFEIKIHFNFRFTLPQTSLMSEILRTFPALAQRAFSLPIAPTSDDDPINRQAGARLEITLFPMNAPYLSGFVNHHAPDLALLGLNLRLSQKRY